MGGNSRQKYRDNQINNQLEKADSLPDDLDKVLQIVPANKRTEVATILASFATHYSGPIPPPEMLKQYDLIYPGLAKEIVEHGLSETKHRHALENKALPFEIKRMNRGQWMGFLIAIFALLATLHLATTGHDTVAGIIGGTTLIALVSVFVVGRVSRTKINRKKDDNPSN